MDGLLKAQGLTQGSVGERMTALGKDPKYLFPDTDAGRAQLLAYLNGLIAGVRPQLSAGLHPEPEGAGDGQAGARRHPGRRRPGLHEHRLRSTARGPRPTTST